MTDTIILITGFAAAAFLGGMLRSMLSQWLPRYVGTFVANMFASLAAGLAIGFATLVESDSLSTMLPAIVATGFAGALSTWSTLASELSGLIKSKRYKRLIRYLYFTLAVGLIVAHRGTIWAGRIYNGWGITPS